MQQSTPIGRITGRVVAILVAFALACAGVITAQRPSHALYFLDKGMHIPISVGAQGSGQGFWFGPWASPQGVPGENVWCIEMWKYNPKPEDSATLSKMSGPRSFAPADLKVTNSQAAWLLDKYQPTLDKRHGAALGFLIHQNFDQDNLGRNIAQDVKTMYNDVKRVQPDIFSLAQAMATEARNSGGFNAKDATVTGEGDRQGAIHNIGAADNKGNWIAGANAKVTLSGPAVFTSTGTNVWTGKTSNKPISVEWRSTGNGTVSFAARYSKVSPYSLNKVHVSGQIQDTVTYPPKFPGDPEEINKPGPHFKVVFDFQPQATTVADPKVGDDGTISDKVTVMADPTYGDGKWVQIDGTYVPVTFEGTAYHTGMTKPTVADTGPSSAGANCC